MVSENVDHHVMPLMLRLTVKADVEAMYSMLCLSAQVYRIFVTDFKACLESMQLPCFNSCGKMTFVVLRCLSRNAWEYIMALTLMGVRHLISPRWLEKM